MYCAHDQQGRGAQLGVPAMRPAVRIPGMNTTTVTPQDKVLLKFLLTLCGLGHTGMRRPY